MSRLQYPTGNQEENYSDSEWENVQLKAKIKDLKRQLEEAREDVKTYKYDLEILVSIVTDCVYDMSEEECYDTLKQVADHYKQLKEKGDGTL